jgi:hypothetical protein
MEEQATGRPERVAKTMAGPSFRVARSGGYASLLRRRSFTGRSSAADQDALEFDGSDEFQPELAADRHGNTLKGVQCKARIGGIEQTVERSTAGLHADGHGGLDPVAGRHLL